MEFMDSMLVAMRSDLAKIKQDAEQAQTCLVVAAAGSAGSPGATVAAAKQAETEAAELHKQLDELAEELLTRQQLLGLKSSGRSPPTPPCGVAGRPWLPDALRRFHSVSLRASRLKSLR